MTYRARCNGRKGHVGRRSVNLAEGLPDARTRPTWVTIRGTHKLIDRRKNAEAAARIAAEAKTEGTPS